MQESINVEKYKCRKVPMLESRKVKIKVERYKSRKVKKNRKEESRKSEEKKQKHIKILKLGS